MPRTKAGERLLRFYPNMTETEMVAEIDTIEDEARAMTGTEAVNLRVERIEAQAVAAERERIRDEIGERVISIGGLEYVPLPAVRAIINRKATNATD